jgi:hypothetical protein
MINKLISTIQAIGLTLLFGTDDAEFMLRHLRMREERRRIILGSRLRYKKALKSNGR